MAIGGTTLSAGIADAQAQLAGATAAGSGTGSIAQLASAYSASGGGPTLAFLGFNPFQIIATGSFGTLYWSLVVIFLGIMAIIALQQSLRGRQTMTARHPLAALAQINFRLLLGAILIANTPLLYALLITINGAVSEGVQAMATEAMGNLLQSSGMGPLTFAQARQDAIRDAAARRAIALHPAGAARAEMIQLGLWYNAMADAINAGLSAQSLAGQLPLLDSTVWSGAQTPDDRVSAYVGRALVQNFGPMLADLGALPAASGSLSIAFPAGQATGLTLLSAALAADDAQAAAALAQPAVPSDDAALESARQLYAREVLTDTLGYLDTQVLATIGASPTLAQRAQAWFSDRVERAAAAAGGFRNGLREAVDWAGRAIGVVLTRMVAFLFAAAVKVLIEVNLFVLVIAMPFWLLPATEEAFYGVLRSLFALSVVVPAYQFIMLFVDALMALVLKYILFGPLAAGSGGAAAAGGAAYAATAALAVAGSGGEIIALASFCYLVAYVFLAVYAAIKTPKIVAVFLKGAGAAGAFLSTFATGLIAGASTALATAAVGGGGIAGGLLGAGGGRGGWAAPPSPAGAGPPSPPGGGTAVFRPQLGRVTARSLQPPAGAGAARREAGPAWGETARFGLRTFFENLSSTSPGDGFETARKAWERQQKLKEKEEDARLKAETKAEKEAARPPPRRR